MSQAPGEGLVLQVLISLSSEPPVIGLFLAPVPRDLLLPSCLCDSSLPRPV